MARPPSPPSRDQSSVPRPRSWTTSGVLIVGAALGFGFLLLAGLTGDEVVRRYTKHDVEKVEVILFFCALSALGAKLWGYRTERAAFRQAVLPAWDGKPVLPAEAGPLWLQVRRLGLRWQKTFLVRRVLAVLDFVRGRGSADDLDDQLRTLADTDALALEGSYALVRFITWAIPILGFLGTVLGITGAIAGITPEKLEKDLSQVTDGLALAFDATALGLALTMLTMFCSFLVDRAEQGLLLAVDQYADGQLSHRFERAGAQGGEFAEVVRQHTQALLRATEQLVQKQAAVWAKALADYERQRADVEQRQQKLLLGALEAMLERTLQTHAGRLADLEKRSVEQGAALVEQMAVFAAALRDGGRQQQESLAQVLQAVAAQAEAVARVQDGGQHLLQLQEVLAQNLTALAGAGAFEQAVHSLTAAVHLLTTRTVTLPSGAASRLGQRPGGAAA